MVNMENHKFPYIWTLKDANFAKNRGKVFSCFACGGGSTMGYKLASYDVIGCNEIDPRMNKVYVANHHPKHNFLMDIKELVGLAKEHKVPEELYNLDILDGSPPCSSFSMAGSREDGWGKEKKFREGQTSQVLDTLFFDFIDLAKELQPKVVIAENVKGLLLGEAKDYVRKIYKSFDEANYVVTHQLLDASVMGVPQRRERVFFLCVRKDLYKYIPKTYDLFDSKPLINLNFNEDKLPIKLFLDYKGRKNTPKIQELWLQRRRGDASLKDVCKRVYGKESFFSEKLIYPDDVCLTLTSNGTLHHFDEPKYLSEHEVKCVSTFPQDYDFGKEKPEYICGMSVPPVMMAQVASRVYEQWLSKIRD